MNRASRPRLSRISGSSYASKLLGRAGDGSTLTLDFTTGVLDPRLTFTRSSDATFINSSGQVQYADANWVRNSTMLVSTGWTAATVNGGTATINGDGSVTFASTAGRITWLQTLGLASGLPITFSIEVTALTAGDIRVSDLFAAGFGFGSQIYHHTNPSGVTQNNISSSAGLGTFGVGLYTVTATTTGTTNNIIFGTDCNGINRTGSVTIRNPQLQYGTVVPRRVYVPNSSTSSAKWDSARFDYDPTTLAPRGLLVEGASTNLLQQSADWTVSPWSKPAQITWDGTTYATAPDGTNTAKQVTVTVGTSASVSQGIANATNRTVSLWIRAGSLTSFSVGAFDAGGTNWGNNGDSTCSIISGPGSVTQQVGGLWSITGLSTTQWTRVQVFRSSSYGALLVYPGGTGTVTGTGFMWGMQMEAGNGASSLIPTGASQGSRAADVCYMANADYGFSTSGGTYLAEWHRGSIISTAGGGTAAFATDYASGRWLGIYTAGASSTGTAGSWSGYLNVSGAVSGINKMAVSYSSWVASASGNTSLNGGAIVSGTLTLGTTPTYLFVGAASGTSPYNGGGYRDPLNNCVRRIKYWPSVLPNAQLQSLTTP